MVYENLTRENYNASYSERIQEARYPRGAILSRGRGRSYMKFYVTRKLSNLQYTLYRSINVCTCLYTVFYISFVVTPFCSNASELVSSLMFAAKKTKTNSSLTFSQVHVYIHLYNTHQLIWSSSTVVWSSYHE